MKWIGRVVLLLLIIVMVSIVIFTDVAPVNAIDLSQIMQPAYRQQIYSGYKSKSLVTSYAPLSNPPGAGPFLTEVAPDDPSIMASADISSNIVWVSLDGGDNWTSLGVPEDFAGGEEAIEINDIAVSLQSAGMHYIAVAGKEQGNRANIWYFNLGHPAPTWQETNNRDGFAANQENSVASAVAFSPAFPIDLVMVAVTGVMDNSSIIDYVFFENFGPVGNPFGRWNHSAGFENYPVTIVSDDGITGIHSSYILLDPGYLGSDEMLRIAYVCLNLTGDADAQALSGYYRLDNTEVSKIGECPEPEPIDTLVGGEVCREDVFHVLTPWFGVAGLAVLGASVVLLARRRINR
jgi:hypothetical protein